MTRLALKILAVGLVLPRTALGQDLLGQVTGVAEGLQKQAESVGESISSQMTPALSSAKNATMTAVGDLKRGGERAAVKALLWASGRCPELREGLDEAPAYLARSLARALAGSNHDPSSSKGACVEASRSGLERAVETELGSHISDQEKLAAKLSLEEELDKVCTDDLMESLATMEEIRAEHREQYSMAVGDRLMLSVLTRERLEAELSEYCGGGLDDVSQLFSDDAGERAASGSSGVASATWLLPAAGAALVAAAALAAMRRGRCSVARCLLGEDAASLAEQGLSEAAE